MAYKAKLIAALAASLAATVSIALAETGGQATRGADQLTNAMPTGRMTRMAEHCNAMIKTMWQ
jgi:hypothetical protein